MHSVHTGSAAWPVSGSAFYKKLLYRIISSEHLPEGRMPAKTVFIKKETKLL